MAKLMYHNKNALTLGCGFLAASGAKTGLWEELASELGALQFPLRSSNSQILINKPNQDIPSPRTVSVFFFSLLDIWFVWSNT